MNRSIKLDIEYSEEFEPDILEFDIVLTGKSDTVEAANAEMATKIERVASLLDEADVDTSNLKTLFADVATEKTTIYTPTPPDNVNFHRYYSDFLVKIQDKEVRLYEAGDKIKGYSYQCHMTFGELISNNNADKIWNALMTCAAEYEDGFSFHVNYELEDRSKCVRSIKQSAIKAAKEEATGLAEAAEATLGPVISIDYSTQFFGRDKASVFCAAENATFKSAGMQYQMPKFDPKPIRVSCSATIEYELLIG